MSKYVTLTRSNVIFRAGGTNEASAIVFNISLLVIPNICGGVRASPSVSVDVTDLSSKHTPALRANARVSPGGHYLSLNKHITRALLV